MVKKLFYNCISLQSSNPKYCFDIHPTGMNQESILSKMYFFSKSCSVLSFWSQIWMASYYRILILIQFRLWPKWAHDTCYQTNLFTNLCCGKGTSENTVLQSVSLCEHYHLPGYHHVRMKDNQSTNRTMTGYIRLCKASHVQGKLNFINLQSTLLWVNR